MFWHRRNFDGASEAAKVADKSAADLELDKTRDAKTRELSEKNVRDAALWDERVESMPPYVPKPVCVKCGDAGVSVQYLRPVYSEYIPGLSSMYTFYPSYSGEPAAARHGALAHKCEHCGYTWKTQAADHNGIQKEQAPQ